MRDDRTGPTDLGRIFFFAEFAIAVAGWVLGINPFDQPNVQEAKDATTRVLDRGRPRTSPTPTTTRCARCSAASAPPNYLAVLGYVEPSAAFDAAVDRAARRSIRDATQVRDDVRLRAALPALDRPAPQGRAADRPLPPADPRLGARRRDPRRRLRLHALKHAQATGDLETLRAHDLPAERVTLEGDDPAAALRALTERMRGLV